jgi:hypothetical protein
MRRALALLLLASVVACYPEFNWRELNSPEGRFAVLLPGKSKRDTRPVLLGGVEAKMHMHAVQVSGMAFGVGYVDLPQGTDAMRAVTEGRDALVRNIAGRITAERDIELQGARGVEFEAAGTADGEPMRLAARVLPAGGRFYQIVFIGRAAHAVRVDIALFLESFRLLLAP